MTTRYRSHDMEDVHATQVSASLDLAPHDHTTLKRDNESSDENKEETDTCHPLAELLVQFRQTKEQFASFKSTTHPSTPMTELMHLTDKPQHLPMMLQMHSAPPHLMRNQCTKLCRHKQPPCRQHRERQTSPQSCLQDIPTFNGQDSHKLEDWTGS